MSGTEVASTSNKGVYDQLVNICSALTHEGTESLILTINTKEKSGKYVASRAGGGFLWGCENLFEQFYQYCLDMQAVDDYEKLMLGHVATDTVSFYIDDGEKDVEGESGRNISVDKNKSAGLQKDATQVDEMKSGSEGTQGDVGKVDKDQGSGTEGLQTDDDKVDKLKSESDRLEKDGSQVDNGKIDMEGLQEMVGQVSQEGKMKSGEGLQKDVDEIETNVLGTEKTQEDISKVGESKSGPEGLQKHGGKKKVLDDVTSIKRVSEEDGELVRRSKRVRKSTLSSWDQFFVVGSELRTAAETNEKNNDKSKSKDGKIHDEKGDSDKTALQVLGLSPLKSNSEQHASIKNLNDEEKLVVDEGKPNTENEIQSAEAKEDVFRRTGLRSKGTAELSPLKGDETKAFFCAICKKDFYYKSSFYRHRRVYHNLQSVVRSGNLYTIEDTLTDKDQNNSVTDESAVKQDSRIQDTRDTNKGFQCEICKLWFCYKKTLNRHHRNKHSDVMSETETVTNQESVDGETHNGTKRGPTEDQDSSITNGENTSNELGESAKMKSELEESSKVAGTKLGKKYTCPVCKNVFTCNKRLRRHLIQVHKKKRSVCKTCGVILKSFSEMKLHYLKEHDRNKVKNAELEKPSRKYTCNVCNGRFSYRHTLKRHLWRTHNQVQDDSDILKTEVKSENLNPDSEGFPEEKEDQRVFVCPECKKIFVSNQRLRRHLQQVHKKVKSVCKRCGKVLNSPAELHQHYADSHLMFKSNPIATFSHRCKICRKYFRTKSALEIHRQMHGTNSDVTYSCHRCGKRFVTTMYLSQHLLAVHKEKGSVCRICRKIFLTKQELYRHTRATHPRSDSDTCNECGEKFDSIEKLAEHRKLHGHDKSRLVCEICGQTFLKTFLFNIHKRTHSGEKPFKCSECNEGFISSQKLRLHKVKHMGPTPFMCEICGMCFAAYNSVLKHSKKHKTGPKIYKCEFCDRQYLSAEGQRGHMISNHAELMDMSKVNYKVHKCEYCGKCFAQKHLYTSHISIYHTGSRPVKCDICGKGFLNVDRLKRHKFTHTNMKKYTCNICNNGSGANDLSKLNKHFNSVRHHENCDKMGIAYEDGKLYTTFDPVSNEDVSQDLTKFVPRNSYIPKPQRVETDMQTTECVIITLPENMVVTAVDDAEVCHVEDAAAIQSVLTLQ